MITKISQRAFSSVDVVTAEDIDEDGEEKPEPDHPEEEDEHRPQDV